MVRRFEYELVADYYQFYLQDEGATGDLSNSWTQEAVDRLLAVAPGTIGVGTVRNMRVPVVVEVSDTEPDEDVNAWDQVNECSLDVLSGRMVVAGCTDYFPDAARIEVPRVEVRFRNWPVEQHRSSRGIRFTCCAVWGKPAESALLERPLPLPAGHRSDRLRGS